MEILKKKLSESYWLSRSSRTSYRFLVGRRKSAMSYAHWRRKDFNIPSCRACTGKNHSRNFTLADFPIDHSFLNYKKELLNYGYKVGKISLKEQTVVFEKA